MVLSSQGLKKCTFKIRPAHLKPLGKFLVIVEMNCHVKNRECDSVSSLFKLCSPFTSVHIKLLLGVSWSKVHLSSNVFHYLNITVMICESYCIDNSKNIDKMKFLSFLIFALLFGVPCFGETAQLVRNHPVPTAGVPTPYHCGEFCQHM